VLNNNTLHKLWLNCAEEYCHNSRASSRISAQQSISCHSQSFYVQVQQKKVLKVFLNTWWNKPMRSFHSESSSLFILSVFKASPVTTATSPRDLPASMTTWKDDITSYLADFVFQVDKFTLLEQATKVSPRERQLSFVDIKNVPCVRLVAVWFIGLQWHVTVGRRVFLWRKWTVSTFVAPSSASSFKTSLCASMRCFLSMPIGAWADKHPQLMRPF